MASDIHQQSRKLYSPGHRVPQRVISKHAHAGFVVVGCSSTLLSLLSLSFLDPKSVAKLSLAILTLKFMFNSHFAINSKNPMPKLYFIATVSSLYSTKHASQNEGQLSHFTPKNCTGNFGILKTHGFFDFLTEF